MWENFTTESELYQQWYMQDRQSKWFILKFTGIIARLTDNVSTYYITLCSVFFAELLTYLQTEIITKGFRIP